MKKKMVKMMKMKKKKKVVKHGLGCGPRGLFKPRSESSLNLHHGLFKLFDGHGLFKLQI